MAGLGIAACVAELQREMPAPDVTVARVYEANGIRIEGLGVCDIASDHVDCWNMDGRRDLALVKAVTAKLAGSYNDQVTFRFGQKNRWLVMRKTGTNSVNYEASVSDYVQRMGTDNGDLDLIRLQKTPPGPETEITAILFNLAGPPAIEVPFALGKKATIAGVEIEIGPWKPYKPAPPNAGSNSFGGMYNPLPKGKSWTIVMGAEKLRWQDRTATLSYIALDTQGKEIRYVDKNGDPVSSVKVLSERPAQPANPPGPEKYTPAMLYAGQSYVPGAMTVLTNVNPRKIGVMRISAVLQKRVLITGFPLDAREGGDR